MLESNNIVSSGDLLDAKSTNFIQPNFSKTSTDGICFFSKIVDSKKGTGIGESAEENQSVHVPSPKMSRRTSTTVIGDGQTQKTDSTYFIQRNDLAESTANAEINKSSKVADRRKSLIKKEENGNRLSSRREYIVNSAEEENQLESLMKSGEEVDPLFLLKQENIGSNDDFETKLIKFPNISVGQQIVSKGEENAASPKLSRRRQSFAEGSEIADPTKEISLNNSGRKASLWNEDIAEQNSCRLKVQSKSEENENEYLPSPNISRTRKSLAKSGDDKTIEQCLSALKEKNDRPKTDDNETQNHISIKDSSRKKYMMKSEYNGNSLPFNRQRRQSNVTSEEDETHGGTVVTQIERGEDVVNENETSLDSQQEDKTFGGNNSQMTTKNTMTQTGISVVIHQEQHRTYMEIDGVMTVKSRGRRRSIIKEEDSRSQSASPNVQQRRKLFVKSEEKQIRMMHLCNRIHQEQHQTYVEIDGVMTVKSRGRRRSIIKEKDSRSQSASPNIQQRRKLFVKSEEKQIRMMHLCNRKTCDADGNDMCKSKVTKVTYASGRRKSIVHNDNSVTHEESPFNATKKRTSICTDEDLGTKASPVVNELFTCLGERRASVVSSCNNEDDENNALDQLQLQKSNDENNDKEIGTKTFRKKKKTRKVSRSSSDRPRRTSLIYNANGSLEPPEIADNKIEVAIVINSPSLCHSAINNGEDVTQAQILSPLTQKILPPLNLTQGFANMNMQDPISPRSFQRRKSFQATDEQGQFRGNDDRMPVIDMYQDADMQPPISTCEEKNGNPIEDSASIIRQNVVSQRVQQRRKSIQDADDIGNQASRSPRLRQSVRQRRKLIQDADDTKRQASMSPQVQQRRKSIQDADDIGAQASRSPRLRHSRKLIQDDEDPKRYASMSPMARHRRNLIQDVHDTKRQASRSPILRHRRKLVQDDEDPKRYASMSPMARHRRKLIQDPEDVTRQAPMSPQVQQRRKSIQDADEIKAQSLMSPLVRPRRKSIKDPEDVTTHASVSPNFQQRRKSIQDNDENMQHALLHSRLRQKRKSIQEATDIMTQQRRKFLQDSVDTTRQASLSSCLQQRRKSIHDNDENMRIVFLSPHLRQQRNYIQDSDEDMIHSPLSPLSPLAQQRRKSIQNADDSMSQIQAGPYFQQKINSIQYNDAIVGNGFMSPQLRRRREYIPEVGKEDVPMEMRVRPRRKSFQGGERIMPHFPTSHALLGRGKYMYDSDGMAAKSLVSPSVRQMLQRVNDTRNHGSPMEEGKGFDFSNIDKGAVSTYDQQGCFPVFESGDTEYPARDPVTLQVADNSFMLSSPRASRRVPAGTAPNTNEDVAMPIRGRRRKMSLPVLGLHGNEVYDQSQQDANSLTVLSLNQEGKQQIDGNFSPSNGRDSKPLLIQKHIREKLAKSNRRSSLSTISELSGIMGMDIGVKQVELAENVGPFSRSARKALRASTNSLAQDAPEPEPNKSQYRRKASLPTSMLTQFIPPDSEAMTNNISYFQQSGQFEASRRKTRRMSLPEAYTSSSIGNSTIQSFCHHIPGEFRRSAAARHVKSSSENIASQKNIYLGMDYEDITPDEEVFLGMENNTLEHDDLPQRQSPTSPVVSDIEDNDDEKVQEDENQNPLLEREYSMSEETILPPRTPEPAVMAEFCEDGNGPESQSNGGSSYQPRYCWCTRCKLMYRMYKDEDSKLEAWGNYPCFKF